MKIYVDVLTSSDKGGYVLKTQKAYPTLADAHAAKTVAILLPNEIVRIHEHKHTDAGETENSPCITS